MYTPLIDAERVTADGWRTITVGEWTNVAVGSGWVVTVTPAGLACDCGKGVMCSLNIRTKIGA